VNTLVVGVGDCLVSKDPQGTLVTYALGSCIAILIHDPVARVGGLLHYMLPESSIDSAKARQRPFMYADTGIPILFRTAYRLGAEKSRLYVAAVGGAQVMDPHGTFNIGKKNYFALRKIFQNARVTVDTEEVGGTASRTVRLEIATGKILLRQGEEERELPKTGQFKTGLANGIQHSAC
jgi:chemotaxis protein CheD